MTIEKNMPFVSVVTVVLNEQSLLNQTVKSVASQDYHNLEHIIVDGMSTDGTVDFIQSLKSSQIKWVSESDKGIYDAMNKGVRIAEGDWIIFLNAGDLFASSSIVTQIFERIGARHDLIYGDTYFIKDDIAELVTAKEPEMLWQALNFNHNSLFTRRELLLEHPFTSEYKIVADSEFVIWAYQQGKSFLNTKLPINKYERGGFSDINSVMRTVERWKLVSDKKINSQTEINEYYFQRLLWEDSCKEYLQKTYNIKI